MAILVKYDNDEIGYISKYELDELINTGRILAFMRPNSSEWIDPRIGPIRNHGSCRNYDGPERRSRW